MNGLQSSLPMPVIDSCGVVVHAAYLGIYGNCVVIDHGLGVQTLYGHLSSIGVKVGDKVHGGSSVLAILPARPGGE